MFLCKAAPEYLSGYRKGIYSQVDEAVLHFIPEIHERQLPITHYAKQLKKGEIAKPLGTDRRHFKALSAGMSHTCMTQDDCPSIRHQCDQDILLILNRGCLNSSFMTQLRKKKFKL